MCIITERAGDLQGLCRTSVVRVLPCQDPGKPLQQFQKQKQEALLIMITTGIFINSSLSCLNSSVKSFILPFVVTTLLRATKRFTISTASINHPDYRRSNIICRAFLALIPQGLLTSCLQS